MKATTSGNFKPTKLPEPQTTVARCYSMIDIGTVPNIYEGKVQGQVHRIFITWELPKLKAVFNEEKGVVSPIRDSANRRLFSESDIKAAQKYLNKNKGGGV